MIANAIITSSETTILTNNVSGKQFAIVSLLLCNTTTSEDIITVHCKISGQSKGDSNTIIKELSIPAKDTLIEEFKIILGYGDLLTAIATTGNRVTATLSYMEV